MARPRIPVFVEPMIATRASEIPTGADWVHERKHDGYRILAYINYGDVRLLSRSGKDWNKAFAPIGDALRRMGKRQAIIDGEVAVKDAHGAASVAKLRKIAKEEPERLVYYAFDLLWLDGFDLRGQDLVERKKRLKTLLKPMLKSDRIAYCDHVPGPKGPALFKDDETGIVSKLATSPYWGGPSPVWLKSEHAAR